MAWTIRSLVGSLLGRPGPGDEQRAGTAEVALDVFALERADPGLARKLFQGQELELATGEGGSVEARLRGRTAGVVPAVPGARLASLLGQGARLGCRVVLVDAPAGLVRVRVSVLM